MENFKEASKQKLRFQTPKGQVSTEQLWDLSLADLDTTAVELESEYNESGKKSFVVKRSVKDETAKLKLDIVVEIITTKMREAEAARTVSENRKHNEKIDDLIVAKQEGALKKKSVKELVKMKR